MRKRNKSDSANETFTLQIHHWPELFMKPRSERHTSAALPHACAGRLCLPGLPPCTP